jgi:hypothetical protein
MSISEANALPGQLIQMRSRDLGAWIVASEITLTEVIRKNQQDIGSSAFGLEASQRKKKRGEECFGNAHVVKVAAEAYLRT